MFGIHEHSNVLLLVGYASTSEVETRSTSDVGLYGLSL